MESNRILSDFPNSIADPFIKTSEPSPHYNCLAWACGDNQNWYWPDEYNFYLWPEYIPREVNIENFIWFFRDIGFEICIQSNLEIGFDKIAIYCDSDKIPTHVARQLKDGFWTSKLGQDLDVSHTIFAMSDGYYGNVAVYMKRKNA